MTKPRKTTKPTDPLERSIHMREKGIERMELNIQRIREAADEQIAEVRARIKEKRVLLDALKRGKLS